MRALITGGSGFIGSRLVERFQKMEWDVTAIGRRHLTFPGYVRHNLAFPLPGKLGPFDVVIHAAARSSPWGSRAEHTRDNVLATQHVLDYCTTHGLPRLIFFSSPAVYYRQADQWNLTEASQMPTRAVNHYATTKRIAEKLVRRYPGAWVILRPRAVFGPGDTVLLPRILRAAREGRLPLLTSSTGPAYGDLLYIDNLVDQVVKAATKPQIHGSYNLTNAEPVPIMEFLIELFVRLGINPPTRKVPVPVAMAMATLLEWTHAVFMPHKEPAITRFGVQVLGCTKTFDVSKMLRDMGPPRISLQQGADCLVAWLKGEGSSFLTAE